jgi:hypothetical protein
MERQSVLDFGYPLKSVDVENAFRVGPAVLQEIGNEFDGVTYIAEQPLRTSFLSTLEAVNS